MEPRSRNHSPLATVRRKKNREEASASERVFWEMIRKDRLGYDSGDRFRLADTISTSTARLPNLP